MNRRKRKDRTFPRRRRGEKRKHGTEEKKTKGKGKERGEVS